MSTKFCVRLNGGPYPGVRLFGDDERAWPPDEVLYDEYRRGEYRRVSYSALAATDPKHHIIRGAEYVWHAYG